MYYSYKPPRKKRILFFVYYVLLIAFLPFGFIFLIKSYGALVRFLFRLKETDYLFNPTGHLIFGTFGFFLWIPFSAFILYLLFSFLFDMNQTFEYYDDQYKNNSVIRSSFGSFKADKTFCIIAEIIALIIFLFSIFYNIRVTDEGISHKKFFSFRTEKIEWQDISKIEFDLEIKQYSKGKSAVPHYIIYHTKGETDIWNGLGMGSPEPQEIIGFTDLALSKNKNIILNVNFHLDSEKLEYLQKTESGEEFIREVYNNLRSRS